VRARLPTIDHTALMHPTLHRAPFTRAGWIFEHELDGFRALARTGPKPALISRNGLSYATAFPEIMAALRRFRVAAVIDCELVVVDANGRPQWERLRRRARIIRLGAPEEAAAYEPASLYAFDVLAIDYQDLRERPLFERKRRLAELVDGNVCVRYVKHLEAHGEALFALACELDFEGIVAKQADSPYRAGRQQTWVKVKNAGYSRPEALRFRE
jgi:bifunctional non-homologous end joining protein LigD